MRTLVFLICRTKWRKWNVQCRSNSGADLHRYKEEEKEEEEKEGEEEGKEEKEEKEEEEEEAAVGGRAAHTHTPVSLNIGRATELSCMRHRSSVQYWCK